MEWLLIIPLIFLVISVVGNLITKGEKINVFRKDEVVIFNDEAGDGEVEYRISGTNFRDLRPSEVGRSDEFSIIPEQGNKHDKYAVKVLNNHRIHVGYIAKDDDNKFWHKALMSGGEAHAIKCRGFIGRFRSQDDGDLAYYGKIFLPEISDEERKTFK